MSKQVPSIDSCFNSLSTAAYKRAMGETSGRSNVVAGRDELGR